MTARSPRLDQIMGPGRECSCFRGFPAGEMLLETLVSRRENADQANFRIESEPQ